MKDESKNADDAGENGKNWLEWTVFAISMLLVAATATVLGMQVTTHGAKRPDLDVELGQAETSQGWTRVPVRVINRGERAVEDLTVQVVATGDGNAVQATCRFDYVPDKGERKGMVQFRARGGAPVELEGTVVGFSEP